MWNSEGLSQSVGWMPGCNQSQEFSVAPVYRLARFPTERDTTDVVGPEAHYPPRP
jgi:hypothetical protein